ncbi:unnamed protein product [Lathyrus oleraceus]
MSFPLFLTLLLLSFSTFIAQAIVPQNETFKFVNSGELGPFIVEYGADYRMISIFNAPFQVGFYNTTPNAYTLALRIGLRRSEQLFRWVWEANRGNPVDENATFSLTTNGNLELANSNGRIVWQTNTSNKGVVAFRLLPNGNMVLIDAKGKFIWQSFDHPTDTLLVDQYLKPNGPSKLVSRLSEKENLDGPYSLVLEPKGLALYYKSKNSPKPILYWQSSQQGSLENVTLTSDSESFEIRFDTFFGTPVNNSTLTYLRLGIDGNIKFHTYFLDVRDGVWKVTYTLFDRDFDESECQLPERCGKFGLCEDNQCVGCPLENGVLGWSNKCSPKPLGVCKASEFHYYKIEGVEHYMSKYTIGDRVSEDGCGSKCTKDCKCVGYFYHKDNSRCWIAYDLQTLTRVANATHVGYVKVPNK